jgi:predicted transcriptional regulator YdeE
MPKSSRSWRRLDTAYSSTLERPVSLLMEPIAVAADSFLVVGIKTRTTNRIESAPETAKIPALWRRYIMDKTGTAVTDRVSADEVIVVYTDFVDDSRGAYNVIIGPKVPTLDHAPKGMDGVAVDAGRYIRFAPEDRTCQSMVETWDEIRRFFRDSHENERAFTTEFEVHRPDGWEIYVSVK